VQRCGRISGGSRLPCAPQQFNGKTAIVRRLLQGRIDCKCLLELFKGPREVALLHEDYAECVPRLAEPG